MFNKKTKYVRNSYDTGFFSGMPLFFKLWFGFILIMVISVFAFVGYTLFAVVSDPEATAREAGRLVGEVAAGYEEAANK